MTVKNRRELKQKYRTGAQPTAQDYADLIDSGFNAVDDGIFKPIEPHLPLRIKGNGSSLSVLDLYDDATHNWRFGLMSGIDSGFNIADAAGSSHLFMESGSGNLGLGSTKPKAKLHINQSAALGDALYVQDSAADLTPTRISNAGHFYISSLKDGEDGGPLKDASLYVNGDFHLVDETSDKSYLHVNKKGVMSVNGEAVGNAPFFQVNCGSKFVGDMEVTQGFVFSGHTHLDGDLLVKGKLTVEKEMEIKATIGANGQTIKLGDSSGDQVELPGKLNSGTAQPLEINDGLKITDSLQLGSSQTVSTISNALGSGTSSSSLLTELAIHKMLPKGSIIMWSGNTVPSGWGLCDGGTHNGVTTPNLKNRFIVGAGDDYNLGATGGVNTVTLTAEQSGMPAHSVSGSTNSTGRHDHSYTDVYINENSDSGDYADGDGTGQYGRSKYTGYAGEHSHSININISKQNASQSHENRPPYYALSYIMKTTG